MSAGGGVVCLEGEIGWKGIPTIREKLFGEKETARGQGKYSGLSKKKTSR
jgi:hypothetical protein